MPPYGKTAAATAECDVVSESPSHNAIIRRVSAAAAAADSDHRCRLFLSYRSSFDVFHLCHMMTAAAAKCRTQITNLPLIVARN